MTDRPICQEDLEVLEYPITGWTTPSGQPRCHPFGAQPASPFSCKHGIGRSFRAGLTTGKPEHRLSSEQQDVAGVGLAPGSAANDGSGNILTRTALALWNMSAPTAAALIILITVVATLAIGSL